MKILAVNPGATSTKIGVFDNNKPVFTENIKHNDELLNKFDSIFDQLPMRLEGVLEFLKGKNIKIEELDGIVGRGGPIRPLSSGTYLVDDRMVEILKTEYKVAHPSLLGGIMAKAIADKISKKAYIVDPVSVDEMEDVARFSGFPGIERISLAHALNLKAAARAAATSLNKKYEEISLVVVHMGSGTSISAHKNGRMIDVENPADEGPFSIDRTGTLPISGVIKAAFSGKYDEKSLKKLFTKEGGIKAYLDTTDGIEIENRIEVGDKKTQLVYDALIYQTAKTIGAYTTVLNGEFEAIVLTGGLAKSDYIIDELKKRISFLGKIMIFPGEDELESLTMGSTRVLKGEEEAKKLN